MTDRFVITGSGRCGTSWISHALSACDVPCGHERVFNATGISEWEDGIQGESSWMAATMLGQIREPIALLVRHPLAVVKSWVEIGFFTWDSNNPTHGPLHAAMPWIYDRPSPQDRALDMWLSLTEAALTRAELVLRLERLSMGRLLAWCGGDPGRAGDAADESIPRNAHLVSRDRTGVVHTPTWMAHDVALARRAWRLATLLGYRGV